MPSPFPGMDPYLEAHWGDVHASFIIYARDQLNQSLPRDLRARVEERVFVETPVERRQIIPDVRILERGRRGRGAGPAGGVATVEPLLIPLDEPITEGFIEIRDASSGHRVITVIEVLSPANKLPGPAQEKYLRKRDELYQAEVSVVEIDLLRAGERPFPFDGTRLSRSERTAYHVWVRRGWERGRLEVYPVSLREPLPDIRIPLRPSDEDVMLRLQPLIEQCYDNGSYGEDIDYRRAPQPPLSPADARWADALLRKAGKRPRRRR